MEKEDMRNIIEPRAMRILITCGESGPVNCRTVKFRAASVAG